MRQIGTLPDPQQAQRFADYLLTQGITTKIDSHDGVATVWVREEDQVPRASEELATFTRDPNSERYVAAVPEAQSLRREIERREKQFRRNLIDVRRRWSSAGATGPRPVTNALIGISVLISVLTSFGKGSMAFWLFISAYVPQHPTLGTLIEVWHGQIWRLVTPIFMHGGPLHLIFNLLLLHQIGPRIESRIRSTRYVMLVLVIAAISNVAQYLAQGPAFLGISGVDFGLFGYLWMKSRYDPGSGMLIDQQTVIWILGFGVLCLTGWLGDIANWAHGVGLATGMAIGYAPVAWRKISRR